MPRAVMSDTLGPLENYGIREYDPGPPAAGEVRIAIQAAGVSFVDVLNATGRYQGKAPTPFIPGSEFAGTVDLLGEGVRGLEPGQSVVATSWGGAFADFANVDASSVSPLPTGLSFTQGAVFRVSALTAWHALVDRGRLQPGETLLVLGAGGATGYAAVQIGRYLGARVIASASSAEKRESALAGGAHRAVDARAENWREEVAKANDGRPVDLVFDPVGGDATERAFRCLAYGGRHLVVGFPAGITSLPTNLPLLKGASLVGVNLQQQSLAAGDSAAANLARINELAGQGLFWPEVAEVFPLSGFVEAMQAVERGNSAGRIVLSMEKP